MNRQNKILEIGFGRGQNLTFLYSAGFKHLYGIEIADIALDNLGRENSSIILRKTNGSIIPFEDRIFGLILLIGVFSTITDFEARDKLLREINRVSAPGGSIVLVDYIFDHRRVRQHSNNSDRHYGMLKPGWSDISFVHYSSEEIARLFNDFIVIRSTPMSLYSCRMSVDRGISILLKKGQMKTHSL